ncbi:Sec23 [Spironucleus salmonicida]|uniref:Protein transport protein SEC23 n=1 Tax=Spironucleus salmonicida TaxID=348837 RepID=V6LNC0_9EUKA|nr:Sec23 [Spironucleus salmonicida]|eukprot:EST46157.1 Sec23 [Spironucleus salmonicida]
MSSADIFLSNEDQTGIRAPWNIWPHLKHENMRATVPLSVLYTPLKQCSQRFKYPPVRCTKCTAVLNPYTPVDFNTKQYQCVFCSTNQTLPSSYAGISSDKKPAELHSQYRCIEYEISSTSESKVIVFCIDLSCTEDELEKQKQSVQMAADLLQDDFKVALVTFGTMVNVHEVHYEICPRRVVFRGTVDLSPIQIEQFLSLKNPAQRFVLPLSYCRDSFVQTIEDLTIDPWTIQQKHRQLRCTGLATSIGVSILYSLHHSLVQQHKLPIGKLALFSSGPCTAGPGQIVDSDITQHLRHWPDIQLKNEPAKHVKDCQKYYEKLTERAVASNSAVHIFGCSVDQIGIFESVDLCKKTSGSIVISESFNYQAFTKSWRLFIDSLSESATEFVQAGSGSLTISVSNQIRINGIIGPCASLKQSTSSVSSQEIGEGLTDKWKVNSLDSDLTLAIFFDLADQAREVQLQNRFIQLRTEFTSVEGKRVLRVVSFAFKSDYNENFAAISAGFDQEAAACILSRMAVLKLTQTSSTEEAVRSIDRACIRLSKQFAQFVPNDVGSVRFQPNYEFFPQFLYHFRRSELINLFGQSPDETAMKHFQLLRQNVQQMLSMIQPVLIAYSVNCLDGEPVFLDASECHPDRILIFDSFFNVLVWSGQSVAAWRQAGYHLKPEYANVNDLLNSFKEEVDQILQYRFPSPRYDEADQGSSQARILLARVNPSSTNKSQNTNSGESIATDDVSLQQFLEVLKKAVVTAE